MIDNHDSPDARSHTEDGEATRGTSPPPTTHPPSEDATMESPTVTRGTALQPPIPRPRLAEHHRFVMLQKISEGGFGDVWEAVQASLGRRIAVKRLKDREDIHRIDDAPIDMRHMEMVFRQEAITAGHLEHPNIVPVYDLGLDEHGRPLLAMKLVKGRQWSDTMVDDLESLPPPEYLARQVQVLISVAQAVAFAHSHGIIHRDLKPAQVMIGQYGEVFLMDWGLAMAYPLSGPHRPHIPWAAGPDSPLFHPATPAGTPNYMAPEQTEPSPENLGPWTDVFLLGATLYKVLTGLPPHAAETPEQTFRNARDEKVLRPEIVAPGREIPEALSALAMHALQRDISQRIHTVEEFLEGLQGYLSGADQRRQSVSLTDTVVSRLSEDPTDYMILSECLNSLDRALVLWPANHRAQEHRQQTLARYARIAMENRDLKLARVQCERLPQSPNRDELIAEIQTREDLQRRQDERLAEALAQAKADRDRAETLVRFLLGDLYKALKAIGRLDVVHRVTREALSYFDSMQEEEPTDQSLHNRCIAYLNIGDVLSDEGKKTEANEAYRKANEVAKLLTSRAPDRSEWLLDLADTHERAGQTAYYQGHTSDALTDHATALAIRERLLAAGHHTPPVRRGLASSRHRIGIIHWRNQELDKALQFQTESLGMFRALCEEAPEDNDLRAAVAWNLSTLGNVYRDLGDVTEAIRVTREGLDIREDLVQQQPDNLARVEDLLWTRGNLALLLLIDGQLDESLGMFRADLDLCRRLSAQDPDNVVRLNAVAFPLSMIAEILFQLGQVQEAEKTIRECLAITNRLTRLDPTSTHVLGAFARQMEQLGEMLAVVGRWNELPALIEQSRRTAEQVLEVAPRHGMVTAVLARIHAMLAFLEQRDGNLQASQSHCEQAAQFLESLHLPAEDVDIIDLQAQLALLRGDRTKAESLLNALRARKWESPYLSLLQVETAKGHDSNRERANRQ